MATSGWMKTDQMTMISPTTIVTKRSRICDQVYYIHVNYKVVAVILRRNVSVQNVDRMMLADCVT